MNLTPSKRSKPRLHFIYKAIWRGVLRTFKCFLKENGNNFHCHWCNSYLLLQEATKSKHFDMARFLLDKGAAINIPEKCAAILSSLRYYDTSSPLHYAVEHGNIDLIKIYLCYGSDVNYKSEVETALHTAVWHNRPDIIELLMEYDSDINCTNSNDETPTITAVRLGNLSMIQFLAKYQPEMSVHRKTEEALLKAVNYNHLHIIRYLLDIGVNVNTQDSSGRTPLNLGIKLYYVKRDTAALVTLLLEHGAKVNVSDENGSFPLYNASRLNMVDVFSLLICYGGDINQKCKDVTPLSAVQGVERNQPFPTDNPIHQNAIKWRTLGLLNISDENVDSLHPSADSVFRIYENQCKSELNCIRKFNSNLYFLLTRHINDITYLARNQSLMELICSKECTDKFPLYQSIMTLRQRRVQRRNDLLQRCQDFTQWLQLFVPTSFRLVLSYLSDNDLKSLSEW